MINCYKITAITDREGNPRLDGRYPLRIGRYCDEPAAYIGAAMGVYYIANADDSDYSDKMLTTSKVVRICYDINQITITTLNSIYHFEKVKIDETLL